MTGSGTTVVEASLAGRRGVGTDIDPLALLVSQVKTTALDASRVAKAGKRVLEQARIALEKMPSEIEAQLEGRNTRTRQFIDYWFAEETQIELQALIDAIQRIRNQRVRAFLKLTFSSTIITKASVSFAFDLAHTRPHRAKIVYSESGQVLLGADCVDDPTEREKLLTKTLKSPLKAFDNKLRQNVRSLRQAGLDSSQSSVASGDAQHLPLADNSVDLIVTSPPYAANAIDYMRAHKFSLVWMGYPIGLLGDRRKEYIGGEAIARVDYEDLPEQAKHMVETIAEVDEKKGHVLHRYYSEATRFLREMKRVLKPGKAAIVVVGDSTMRGKNTQTGYCIADIGRHIGFEVPKIGFRDLDRNRRMMPNYQAGYLGQQAARQRRGNQPSEPGGGLRRGDCCSHPFEGTECAISHANPAREHLL
jgi:DNA modification methylase